MRTPREYAGGVGFANFRNRFEAAVWHARYSRSQLGMMLRQSIIGTLTGVIVFQRVHQDPRAASPRFPLDVQAEIEPCQCMRLFDLRNELGDSSRRLPFPGVSRDLDRRRKPRGPFKIPMDYENWQPDHRSPQSPQFTVARVAWAFLPIR